MFKKTLTTLFLLLTHLVFSQYTTEINTNRPSKSLGAFSVGKTVFQIETGINYYKNPYNKDEKDKFIGDIQLRYGQILEELEFVANFSNYRKNKTLNELDLYNKKLFNVEFGAKYLIYDPFKYYEEKINVYSWKANQRFKWKKLIPAMSLYIGANTTLSNNLTAKGTPMVNIRAVMIAQQHFNEKWALTTNFILDKLVSDQTKGYGYVLTLTHGWNSKWSVFVENEGFKNKYYKELFFRTGATTLLNKNLQLDLSAGVNLREKDTFFLGQLGLSWRSDTKYKPIELDK